MGGAAGLGAGGPGGDDGSHDDDPGEALPDGSGIAAHPRPVRSSACVIPRAASRDRWAAESVSGWGVRLGLHLVKGIGEEMTARLDAELARGPYTSLADVVERTGLSEEVVERLIRAGRARLAGPAAAGAAVAAARGGGRHEGARRRADGARCADGRRRRAGRWTSGCPRPRRRRSPR